MRTVLITGANRGVRYLNRDGNGNYGLREADSSGSTDEALIGIDHPGRAFTSYQ